MGRISRLVAGAILLTGCSSAVLETRNGSSGGRIPLSRTLVTADVAEPYRAAVEDAMAHALPGAVAAHALPGGGAVLRSALLGGVEETTPPAEWDAVVLVTVADVGMTILPGGYLGAGGVPPESGNRLSEPQLISVSWLPAGEKAGLDLDVSVLRLADSREVYGVRVHREGPADDVHELAPDAAAHAARELKKARLFE